MVYQKIKIIGIIVASILLVAVSSQSAYAGISVDMANMQEGIPCPRGQKYESFTRPSSGGISTGDVRCVKDYSYVPLSARFSALDIVMISSASLAVIVGVVVGVRKIRQKKA